MFNRGDIVKLTRDHLNAQYKIFFDDGNTASLSHWRPAAERNWIEYMPSPISAESRIFELITPAADVVTVYLVSVIERDDVGVANWLPLIYTTTYNSEEDLAQGLVDWNRDNFIVLAKKKITIPVVRPIDFAEAPVFRDVEVDEDDNQLEAFHEEEEDDE